VSDDFLSQPGSIPPLRLPDVDGPLEPPVDRKDDRYSSRQRIGGFTAISWIATLLIAGFMASAAWFAPPEAAEQEASPIDMVELNTTAKFLVATGEIGVGKIDVFDDEALPDADRDLNSVESGLTSGAVETRFGFTILVAELYGASEASRALQNVDERARKAGVKYTENQQRLLALLQQVYERYSAGLRDPGLSRDDEQFLVSRLGWTGKLVRAPPAPGAIELDGERLERKNEAVRWAIVVAGLLVVFIGSALAGLVLALVFLSLVSLRRIAGRVNPDSRYGAVYIETFAIWFVLFLALNLLVSLWGQLVPDPLWVVIILPLVALGWPAVRGISWREFRHDIGLGIVNPFREMLAGLALYLATVPFLVVAFVASFFIAAVLGLGAGPQNEYAPGGVPHPIIHELFVGDRAWAAIRLLLLTAVAAPITEEIMFRGVLYRHLRDVSRRMSRASSVLVSSLLNGFLFAIIHPQGVIGIPPLMVLGFSFCLAREWRGSLVAPMTMHALNNGFVTVFLIVATT
jgi:membrane protease YdiL (CAAX protease family)